jgi:hypothetical protein
MPDPRSSATGSGGVLFSPFCTPREIFAASQASEQRLFMGDWSFWRVLAQLASPPNALIAVEGADAFRHPPGFPDDAVFERQRLALTRPGRDVLENRNDAVALKPVDRWLGGTHLHAGAVWRWNAEEQRLVAPA